MSEWTPEATEYLEGYLLRVAALARSQGDDGDIIVEDLRTHITTEAEGLAGAIVNLEHLRTILAGIGSPEQVAAGEAPQPRPPAETPRSSPPLPPPPSINVQPAPSSKAGYWIIAAVVLGLGVLAIPLIAAIAIPNILWARMTENEGAAWAAIHTIGWAQEDFQSRTLLDLNEDGIGDYGTLAELAEAGLIDATLATGLEKGYRFRVEVTPGEDATGPGFACYAAPETVDSTGIQHFYIDQTGVLRFERDGSPADANSPPIPVVQE